MSVLGLLQVPVCPEDVEYVFVPSKEVTVLSPVAVSAYIFKFKCCQGLVPVAVTAIRYMVCPLVIYPEILIWYRA